MKLVELNREIKELETKLDDLKMQRLYLKGKRGCAFFKGNSYLSRRSVEGPLRNFGAWARLHSKDRYSLQKKAVLAATNGITDDVAKIETYEEWAKVESIYLDLLKNYVKEAEQYFIKNGRRRGPFYLDSIKDYVENGAES